MSTLSRSKTGTNGTNTPESPEYEVGYPGRPGRNRTFTAVYEGGKESVHQGPGLTLDDVIGHYAKLWAPHGESPSAHEFTPIDTTIYEGDVVAAVIRYHDDGTGRYDVVKPTWETAAAPTPEAPPVEPKSESADQQTSFYHEPHPGPFRTFLVKQDGEIVNVHIGQGLTLDEVVKQESGAFGCVEGEAGYDVSFFEGEQLRAIAHLAGDREGNYTLERIEDEAPAPAVRSITITNPEFTLDELIVELHEVHRWRVDDGDDVQEVAQQILVDGRHVATLTPDEFDDRLKVAVIEDGEVTVIEDEDEDEDPAPNVANGHINPDVTLEHIDPPAPPSDTSDDGDGDDQGDDPERITVSQALVRVSRREIAFAVEQRRQAFEHMLAVQEDSCGMRSEHEDDDRDQDLAVLRKVNEVEQRATAWYERQTKCVALAVLRAGGHHDEAARAKEGGSWSPAAVRFDGQVIAITPWQANCDRHDLCHHLQDAIVTIVPDGRCAELDD